MFDLDVKLDGHFVKWTKNHLIKLQRERKLLPGVLQRVRRFKFSRHFFDDVIGNAGKVVATRIPGNRVGHADVEVELAEADFESPGQLVELVAHAEQK